MNLFDHAIAAHAATIKRAVGYDVVIKRGPRESEVIKGVLTSSTHQVFDEKEGIPTKAKFSDWLFTKSDLAMDGQPVALLPGDLITATIRAVERRFKVVPIDKRPCVEPHDHSGLMVVVHSIEL